MRSRQLVLPLIGVIAIYCAYHLFTVSTRDPTSFFFNPHVGYKPHYSALRTVLAEDFVAHATNDTVERVSVPANKRRLCIGIPSIARDGVQYLQGTVGSLLEGLTPAERSEIYLIAFIPHSDPTKHSAYTEAWLPALADQVLTYDVDNIQLERIKSMEREGGLYREKGLYDYTYLLRECYKKETPYIAIFEDDIMAMDGWYPRTVAAIEKAERLSAEKQAKPDFLYLRLFYTEEYMGWNSEYWRTYLFFSLVFTISLLGLLGGLRLMFPTSRRLIGDGRQWALFTIPASAVVILLFFALGRQTTLALPPGVHLMPKFGCCSQAFVFPRQKAMSLVHWFENKRYGFVDVLTEEYADQHGELRWAVSPSLIQHVGRKSSKFDDYGPDSKYGLTVAEKIWSFGFEQWDWQKLAKEREQRHEYAKQAEHETEEETNGPKEEASKDKVTAYESQVHSQPTLLFVLRVGVAGYVIYFVILLTIRWGENLWRMVADCEDFWADVFTDVACMLYIFWAIKRGVQISVRWAVKGVKWIEKGARWVVKGLWRFVYGFV